LGFAPRIDGHPRVRFATLGFGVKRLRRSEFHDKTTFRIKPRKTKKRKRGNLFRPRLRWALFITVQTAKNPLTVILDAL
jgi:hypothetical protein